MKILIGIAILGTIWFYFYNSNKPDIPQDYGKLKANFHTKLIKQTKAPQPYSDLKNSPGIEKIIYPSGNYQLQALLSTENIEANIRKPAIVYLHGGFALDKSDIEDCWAFINEGYIVLAPSYRGENGNEGNFELFMGEVDDAKAAIKWLAKQLFVDSTHIYVFGHSIGGGVSSLLSLQNDVPIKMSASIGGLYNAEFKNWGDILPFDMQDENEKKMRTLVENVWFMKTPHLAFFGSQDPTFKEDIDYYNQLTKGTKLSIEMVRGDHMSSLQPAIGRFITLLKSGKL
ncbi:MAG TPA: alpha/beta fold hydrolase [Saprospiraceae bacterium]|nr:alpha/beta fold hydrolase [Saprospiraceae bacterium]